MLGVTNLCGDPIMCVVIFEGKERDIVMESGIDPMHPNYDSVDWESFDVDNNYDFSLIISEKVIYFLAGLCVNMRDHQFLQWSDTVGKDVVQEPFLETFFKPLMK